MPGGELRGVSKGQKVVHVEKNHEQGRCRSEDRDSMKIRSIMVTFRGFWGFPAEPKNLVKRLRFGLFAMVDVPTLTRIQNYSQITRIHTFISKKCVKSMEFHRFFRKNAPQNLVKRLRFSFFRPSTFWNSQESQNPGKSSFDTLFFQKMCQIIEIP